MKAKKLCILFGQEVPWHEVLEALEELDKSWSIFNADQLSFGDLQSALQSSSTDVCVYTHTERVAKEIDTFAQNLPDGMYCTVIYIPRARMRLEDKELQKWSTLLCLDPSTAASTLNIETASFFNGAGNPSAV